VPFGGLDDEFSRLPRKTDIEGVVVTRWGQTVPSTGSRPQQQGRPDHRRWTAVYDGHSATVRKQIEQGRSQRGGTWVNVPPCHGLKKNLAPELQTDDCFATGVTRQTLLKPKENVQFQR